MYADSHGTWGVFAAEVFDVSECNLSSVRILSSLCVSVVVNVDWDVDLDVTGT